jgi:hypothetical protein
MPGCQHQQGHQSLQQHWHKSNSQHLSESWSPGGGGDLLYKVHTIIPVARLIGCACKHRLQLALQLMSIEPHMRVS